MATTNPQMDTTEAKALQEAATQTAASASPTTKIGGVALTPPNVTGGYNKAARQRYNLRHSQEHQTSYPQLLCCNLPSR